MHSNLTAHFQCLGTFKPRRTNSRRTMSMTVSTQERLLEKELQRLGLGPAAGGLFDGAVLQRLSGGAPNAHVGKSSMNVSVAGFRTGMGPDGGGRSL